MTTVDLHEPPAAESTRAQRMALIGALAIAAWLFLQLFASVLLPFVAAAGIAYFLDPAARRLAAIGIPRGIAAAVLILGLLTAGLLAVLLLYPLVLSQIGTLLGRVPGYAASVQNWAQQLVSLAQERLGSEYVDQKLRDLVGSQAGSMLSFLITTATRLMLTVLSSGFALFNVLTLLVVTPIVAFYLLRDWPKLIGKIDSWMPRRYADVLRAQAREVDRILSAWIRGQALCCVILAAYYALALTAVGLEFGLIVGLTAGALSFIPYVGTITCTVTSLGLALGQFPDWRGVAMVGVVLVIGQTLEGYVIYPRLLGDRVELSDVWVIFALFAGGAAFGFLGVMLAVPVAATIGVLLRFWLRRYMQSPLYLDPPPATSAGLPPGSPPALP